MVRTARFHIKKTRNGEYRPYLKAINGEQVMGSETYKTLQGAVRWVSTISKWVENAGMKEIVLDWKKEER